MGLFFASMCDGTNLTTYTSSALHISTFDTVAIVASIAQQPWSGERNLNFISCQILEKLEVKS